MGERIRFFIIKHGQRSKSGQTSRVIVAAFALIIALGTLLLTLPVASRSGESHGVLTAFFTATSATCVTGLVAGDTYTLWSGFGQVVIILLIQIGGLGFMTISALISMLLRRRINLRERMVLAQSFNISTFDGLMRLVRHVLWATMTIELVGAALLSIRFVGDFGLWPGIARGLFHSISAFCNAGFDILGILSPGSSVMLYADDPLVCITLGALITIGGLGFFVWEDIYTTRSFKRLSLHSKLVLLITAGLLVFGTAFFLLAEWNNPDTMGNMSFFEKLLASFFQSATLRTAGFASVDQAQLTEASKAVSMVLMLIGGSPGSTAGGIKTVTVGVIALSCIADLKGRKNVQVFGCNIPQKTIRSAVSLAIIMLTLAFGGSILLTIADDVSLTAAMFESFSAIATVGISLGITPTLSAVSKIMLALFMFFGRVGIMTISIALMSKDGTEDKLKYADGQIFIG